MNKFLMLCILILISKESICQTWEAYNRENSNLPSNNVTGISISDNGKVWISTTYGIASYDGEIEIHQFNNSSYGEEIINIWTSSNDNVWVGTEFQGLWNFDGLETWEHYHTNSAGNGIVGFAIDSNDTIWILDKFDHFQKWNGSSWVEIRNTYLGKGLFIDSNDNVWLQSNSSLQKYFNGELLITYTKTLDPSLENHIPDASIYDIVEDSEGNLWMGGNYSGLMKFDGTQFTVFSTENSGIVSNKIRRLAIDENDVLWIGSWDAGLSKFDGTTWTNFDQSNSPLTSPIINDIAIGKDGKVWIANGYNEFKSPAGGQGIFVFDEFNDDSGGVLPETPTNLSITGISINEVMLKWSDNSLNESGFNIERSINNQEDFEQVKFVSANQNTYVDLTVVPGNTYYYRVSAINSQGASAFSNVENIQPKYCTVNKSSYSCYANVTQLIFGEINNTVFNTHNGYYNYLDQKTTLKPGQTLQLTVSFDRYTITSDPIIRGEIYIDWNLDGDFEDENELIFRDLNINGKGTYAISVHVPEDAAIGNTRLRTRTDDDTYGLIAPCGYAEETQDYSIYIGEPESLAAPDKIEAKGISATKIALTWIDKSLNEGSHSVFRSEDGVNFEKAASVDANVIQYVDENLSEDTEYYYKIVASTDIETSGFSETVRAATLSVDFERVTIGESTYGGFTVGAFWGDYNNDSSPDIYFSGDDQLYNYQNAGFIESGLDFKSSGSAAWGDYDNDGDLDLLTSNYNYSADPLNNLLQINNGDGTFDEASPFTADGRVNNCVWVDVNLDGKIDIFLSYLDLNYGKIYINKGEGIFQEHIKLDGASGLASFVDYDNDNDLDLYLANHGRNTLFTNHEGTFTEITTSPITLSSRGSNGASWGDIDNDGDMDLFVANGEHFEEDNNLYLNKGNGSFVEVYTGAIVNDGGESYGSAFADFDNDGNLDIAVANFQQQNFLYQGNGDGTFTKVEESPVMNETMDFFLDEVPSMACAWADYNHDGFSDLVIANNSGAENFIYENSGNSNNWISLNLVGASSNRSAIGSKVKLQAGGVTQSREVTTQTGFAGQNELAVNFGLGKETIIDEIEIRWPSGIVQTLLNIQANQRLEIIESENEVLGFDPSKKQVYLAFPNPFTDHVTIANVKDEYIAAAIFDLNGRRLKRFEVRKQNQKLDLKDLKQGIYFLKVKSSKMERVLKIVKE